MASLIHSSRHWGLPDSLIKTLGRWRVQHILSTFELLAILCVQCSSPSPGPSSQGSQLHSCTIQCSVCMVMRSGAGCPWVTSGFKHGGPRTQLARRQNAEDITVGAILTARMNSKHYKGHVTDLLEWSAPTKSKRKAASAMKRRKQRPRQVQWKQRMKRI